MSREPKLHRVTITFDVYARDAVHGVSVGVCAAMWGEEDYAPSSVKAAEDGLLDRLGPYEISAVEVGKTATLRRER